MLEDEFVDEQHGLAPAAASRGLEEPLDQVLAVGSEDEAVEQEALDEPHAAGVVMTTEPATPIVPPFTLPWMRDGFLGFVVCGRSLFPTPQPVMTVPMETPVVEPVHEDSTGSRDEIEQSFVVKRARLGKGADESKKRSRLIAAWVTLLMVIPALTVVGAQLEELPSAERMESAEYTFNQKRTSTLAMRLSALNQARAWMIDSGLVDWPLEEPAVFRYFKWCRVAVKAKTRCTKLLEALNFMAHVCGEIGGILTRVASSRRLHGVANAQLLTMGQKRQAMALDAWMVEELENRFCMDAFPPLEAVVIGGFLMMLALRARFADMGYWTKVGYTDVEIEVEVSQTKTAGRPGERLSYSYIGPRQLVSGQDWFGKWMQVRSAMGIPEVTFPLFPARCMGVWQKWPASLKDVNSTLRLALQRLGNPRTSAAS